MVFLSQLFASFSELWSSNPTMFFLEVGLGILGSALVFLILYTLRDVLLRTHSFLFQIFSIILVAGLPVVGFLLYLLIRPSRTMRERELEHKVDEVFAQLKQRPPATIHPPKKKPAPQPFKLQGKIEAS